MNDMTANKEFMTYLNNSSSKTNNKMTNTPFSMTNYRKKVQVVLWHHMHINKSLIVFRGNNHIKTNQSYVK